MQRVIKFNGGDMMDDKQLNYFGKILNSARKFEDLHISAVLAIYLALSAALFAILKYSLISLQNPLSDFLFQWQSYFYPLQTLFLKFQLINLNPQIINQSYVANMSQIGWVYFIFVSILNLLLVLFIAALYNTLVQKLLIISDQFSLLTKKLLKVVIISSFIFGLIGIIITSVFGNRHESLTKVFLILCLFIALWIINELKSCYGIEWKRAVIIFILVNALFPIALMLVIFYTVIDFKFLKKSAPIYDRTISLWFGIVPSPAQTFNRMSIGLSTPIIFSLTIFTGLFGLGIIYNFPTISEIHHAFQPFALGFVNLFHKTELAALITMDNFNWNSFENVAFDSLRYIYLFISFVFSFIIMAALVDHTAWMVMKRNKNFKTTLSYLLSITSSVTFYYLVISFLAVLAGYYIRLILGISNPDLESAFLKSLAFTISSIFFIALNIYYVRAFSHIYNMNIAESVLLWLSSLVLLPFSLSILLINAAIEISSWILVDRRIKKLKADIDNLSTITASTPHEDVNTAIEQFSQHLKNRFIYNSIARKRIDMSGALKAVLDHRPVMMITNLLTMADGNDPDLSDDAVRWLSDVFKIETKSHIRLFYHMFEQKIRTSILSKITSRLDKSTIWHKILSDYYELISEPQLTEIQRDNLKRISEYYQKLNNDPLAPEFALIYKIIFTIASIGGITEITRCEKPITAYLQILSPNEVAMQNIFKLFLRISNYQDLFERLGDENKTSFVSMQLGLLVEIDRELDTLKGRDLEKRLLQSLTPRLQNWTMRQNEMLRGSAELIIDLKTKRIPAHEQQGTIVVEIQNAGNALAQNIRLALKAQESDFYKVVSDVMRTTPLMESKANHFFEFTISPRKAGAQRLLFSITYMDIDKQEFTYEYADILHFTERETTDKRKYEIGELINPFIAGTAVADPNMFFGRKNEFQRIRENLEVQSHDNVIVLHGQRRTGKSSILLQMEHHLGRDRYICVFINLEGIISSGMANLLFRIATLITRELEKYNIKIDRPALNDFLKEPSDFFSYTFLPAVYQAIGNRRLLLMLDEFEQIENRVNDGKLDRDIFPFLRHLMQYSEQLSFILAGARQLKEMRSDYWSVLFNITRYVKVGFLDKESSHKLICEPVKQHVNYDPYAIEKIYRVTAGQPYFIQLICHELFNRYRREKKNYLTVQDVNVALREVILTGSGHLDYIWNMATWPEKIVLSALADIAMYDNERVRLSNMGMRLKELHSPMDDRKIREALSHLIDIEILTGDAHFDSFAFRIDLVRLWLKEAHSIGKAIEDYQKYETEGGGSK